MHRHITSADDGRWTMDDSAQDGSRLNPSSIVHRPSSIVRRLTPRVRALSMLAALLLAGVTLSVFNVPLASSATNSVDVTHIGQAVPTDPQSSLWAQAKEATIPLTSQQIYQPGGGTTTAVRVRTLEDGPTIACLVS